MPSYDAGYRDGFREGYDFALQLRGLPSIKGVRKARGEKSSLPTKKKRAGKKDPKMARALKKANAMMRTKSGKLRKGATQAKIMKKAHQLRRKM